mgnify:FL=1
MSAGDLKGRINMKNKIAKLLAVMALVPALLAGCSSSAASDSTEETTSDTAVSAADNAETEAEGGDTATAEDDSLQKVLDSGKFILGLDATFKPMGYTDENDNIVGFDIDVAEEVCARLGVELVKQPIDWDTKEQDLDAGKIDCIWNGMSINASRAEVMNLSEPYMENAMVFVVANGSSVASQADLDGKTVAVQSGSTAQEILEGSDLNVTETALATNVECLQQLELNLVDAVFMDSVVANYEIKETGKDYVILPDGLEAEEYAIGFRKNDNALRDKVQEILSEMKADGKLGEISTAWFGSDITTVK